MEFGRKPKIPAIYSGEERTFHPLGHRQEKHQDKCSHEPEDQNKEFRTVQKPPPKDDEETREPRSGDLDLGKGCNSMRKTQAD